MSAYDAVVLADSPVGYWPLNELAGNALDLSPTGNDGIVTGATQGATGLVHGLGTSYSFDGIDDEVRSGLDVAQDNIFNGGGTVEAWILANSDGELNLGRIVIKREISPGAFRGWIFYVSVESGGGVTLNLFRDFDGGTDAQFTADFDPIRPVSLGVRHHVVVTYNDDAVANLATFYLDGQAISSFSVLTPVGAAESDDGREVIIGNNDAGTTSFDGREAAIAIYDAVLSPAQIFAHWEAGSGGFRIAPGGLDGVGQMAGANPPGYVTRMVGT